MLGGSALQSCAYVDAVAGRVTSGTAGPDHVVWNPAPDAGAFQHILFGIPCRTSLAGNWYQLRVAVVVCDTCFLHGMAMQLQSGSLCEQAGRRAGTILVRSPPVLKPAGHERRTGCQQQRLLTLQLGCMPVIICRCSTDSTCTTCRCYPPAHKLLRLQAAASSGTFPSQVPLSAAAWLRSLPYEFHRGTNSYPAGVA